MQLKVWGGFLCACLKYNSVRCLLATVLSSTNIYIEGRAIMINCVWNQRDKISIVSYEW